MYAVKYLYTKHVSNVSTTSVLECKTNNGIYEQNNNKIATEKEMRIKANERDRENRIIFIAKKLALESSLKE